MEPKTFLWAVVRYDDFRSCYMYRGRGCKLSREVSNYYHIKDSVWHTTQAKAVAALGRLKSGPVASTWSNGFVVGVEPTGSLLAACRAVGGADGRG